MFHFAYTPFAITSAAFCGLPRKMHGTRGICLVRSLSSPVLGRQTSTDIIGWFSQSGNQPNHMMGCDVGELMRGPRKPPAYIFERWKYHSGISWPRSYGDDISRWYFVGRDQIYQGKLYGSLVIRRGPQPSFCEILLCHMCKVAGTGQGLTASTASSFVRRL